MDCFSGFGNTIHFCITPQANVLNIQECLLLHEYVFVSFQISDIWFGILNVVQLRRMAFINTNIAPEGWIFAPLPYLYKQRGELPCFIAGVCIYWIRNGQTFTKILVQVLFGWNDLKSCPISLWRHIYHSNSHTTILAFCLILSERCSRESLQLRIIPRWRNILKVFVFGKWKWRAFENALVWTPTDFYLFFLKPYTDSIPYFLVQDFDLLAM